MGGRIIKIGDFSIEWGDSAMDDAFIHENVMFLQFLSSARPHRDPKSVCPEEKASTLYFWMVGQMQHNIVLFFVASQYNNKF